MRLLAILLTISCTVSGTTISRIVGGHDADKSKYHYQVSIKMLNHHICGGSIITHYHILTAAHCIYKQNPENFAVVAGTNNLFSDGVSYGVNSLKWHQDYNQTLFLNDIGLIRVNRYIEFNTRIESISLPFEYYIPTEQTATVTGWGRLNGDSGGPLVLNNKQIGIVSYGSPCAIGVPDVYTRVFPYKEWITNVTSIGVETNPNTWTVLLFTLSTIIPYIHPLL